MNGANSTAALQTSYKTVAQTLRCLAQLGSDSSRSSCRTPPNPSMSCLSSSRSSSRRCRMLNLPLNLYFVRPASCSISIFGLLPSACQTGFVIYHRHITVEVERLFIISKFFSNLGAEPVLVTLADVELPRFRRGSHPASAPCVCPSWWRVWRAFN